MTAGGGTTAADAPPTRSTSFQTAEVGAAEPEAATNHGANPGFSVRLENFEGPFDLLLQLVSRHRLDVTEVALSQVTDDFVAHVQSLGADWDLDQATSFLVVASTLLELKVVRLLPTAEVEDEEDLTLLEARDLLFARLLQYRAFKQVAAQIETRMATEAARHPRTVGLEERYSRVLPEVLISVGAAEFAALAARVLTPRPEPTLGLSHLHVPRVSVRDEAATLAQRLQRLGTATFRTLSADAPDSLTTVARFLALLELFRERAVAFDQLTPLGELTVRWTGADDRAVEVVDEYDQTSAYDQADQRQEVGA